MGTHLLHDAVAYEKQELGWYEVKCPHRCGVPEEGEVGRGQCHGFISYRQMFGQSTS